MAAKVVDASALGAVLFGEAEGPGVEKWMRGASLYAPSLIRYEIANVCVIKLRRGRDQRNALLASFAMLDEIDMEIVDVDIHGVVDMAGRFSLTAYDASYLWLARMLGAELVTLDTRLAAAMASH
jgi:predicted nucleic acid-binding protein